MAAERKFLAFDLGAESGRAVIGFFDGKRLRLEDAHRFPNGPARVLDTLYWDALRLFMELKQGLTRATSVHGREISGIGVDTWGVDFGLLGRGDVLLGNPRHYRDHGNDGMMEAAFEVVPREVMFNRTGIQFMQFNTLFQLCALKRMQSPLLDAAQTLLLMPDLFHFWFTGNKQTEFSIASTTQMYDPLGKAWAIDLVQALGLPADILPRIVPTATVLGPVRPEIEAETGCGAVQVVTPAAHDTGSAVVAVPASTPDYAYISSGTWSLMGIEAAEPHITQQTRQANFTNEGGAGGTIRLLKNIMGLWLVQACRRAWARHGTDHSYAELTALAAQAAPFVSLVEPDDPSFLAPADMPAALAAFCIRTQQPAPQGPGATIRCCLESLALKYRWVLERLETFRGARIETVHIVGGGTQNRLLCQLAADAMNRPVIAGPVEATAIGNLLMQALGLGDLSSVQEARAVVRSSFALETYAPGSDQGAWEEAYARYLAVRALSGNTS